MALAIAMIVAAGVVVYADFEQNGDPNMRTLSYDLDGGDGETPDSAEVLDGTPVTLPEPKASRSHFTFIGWSDGITVYSPGETYVVTENIVLKAVWTADRYPVTYHLDGGINPEGTADSYGYGEEYVLPIPSREGYVFTGWFSDPELTIPLESVDTESERGTDAYASWEESLVGTGIVMRLSGVIEDRDSWNRLAGTYYTSGTLSFDYVYYEYGEGYYLARSLSVTSNGTETVSEDGYWSKEVSDRVWEVADDTVILETEFGSIECEVWSTTGSNYTETQYIGIEDGELYRIVSVTRTTVLSGFSFLQRTETDTYDLIERKTFDASSYYTLEVYEDVGITVTGDEFATAGFPLTLKATAKEGYTFSGWYDSDGVLLSASSTYVPDKGRLLSDITVYARNSEEYDEPFELSGDMTRRIASNVELSDVRWRVAHVCERSNDAVSQPYYVREGTGSTYTLENAGRYTVTYSGRAPDGSLVRGQYDILACGTYAFSWNYNGKTYQVSLYVSLQDYLECASSNAYRNAGTDSQMRALVTYGDKYVIDLAQQFATIGAGMDDVGRLNLLLSYVQAIPYMYDSDLNGRTEYWKFPLETVVDGAGDCEDTSILFCAVAKAMGYDTALMTLFASNTPGQIGAANHCVSLVSVDGDTGYQKYTTISGTDYYFCETTTMGYPVGCNPWASVRNAKTVVIS